MEHCLSIKRDSRNEDGVGASRDWNVTRGPEGPILGSNQNAAAPRVITKQVENFVSCLSCYETGCYIYIYIYQNHSSN